MTHPFDQLNNMPRRVEGSGWIRWYVNNKLIMAVTTEQYYRGGHVHPNNCQCNALCHNALFFENLKLLGY